MNITCACCGKSCTDERYGVCFPCGIAGARAAMPKSCAYCQENGPPVCPEHDVTDCQLWEGSRAHLEFWDEHGPRLQWFRDGKETKP